MALELLLQDSNTTRIHTPYSDSINLPYSHGSNATDYNDAFDESDEGFIMPVYGQVIIILMYSAITVLSVGGNITVIYVILGYQRMRTVTNYFIVNLACGDMLMAILCIPFTFVANVLVHYWPFGAIMCPLVLFAQGVAVLLSAFTLVAISVDRYIAVIKPLRPRMTTKQAFLIIVGIWFLALSASAPTAIKASLLPINNTDKFECREVWPHSNGYIYSLVILVLQYFLPLFVLMFTYSRIAIVIWIQRPPGEAENNRDQRMAASKRKVLIYLKYALLSCHKALAKRL